MILQSWDMAFKDTKKSDFVVGQVQAAVGADRYLLDQVRARMDLPATLLAVRQLSARWREASLKLVEDKANGPAVIQSLCHEIAGFVEVNPEGGKISRAAAASPQLESGNWYLPHPLLAPWVEEFIGECAAFPAGAYDDQVDAWSQGAKRLLTITAKVASPHRPEPFGNYGEHGWMAS
jgi:predicted phage terminase large subunit-like protein